MKHFVYMIGSSNNFADNHVIGIYAVHRPTRQVNKIVSKGEEVILVSERELSLHENIQRFIIMLAWVAQAKIGASYEDLKKMNIGNKEVYHV